MSQAFDLSEEGARRLDRDDPLAPMGERFFRPADAIYLDGNSLGLACRDAEAALHHRMAEWKALAVRGWLEGDGPWFHYAEDMGALVAPLVGARPEEVSFTGTTTVNLHSMAATFFRPRGQRRKILADALAFPTDVFALRDQLRLQGGDPDEDLVLVPSRDGRTIDEQDVIDQLTDEIALVLLPSVLYRSGQLLDLERLARAARQRAIPIGFDCSHSVGAIPHRLHDWGADFAVWCSYKYLNGGPGCSGFLFLHERNFERQAGLSGWFGADKATQFDLGLDFQQARSAGGWQISSPGILGSATIAGALKVILEAGIDRIREKSLRLTAYLMHLVDERLAEAPHRFRVGTPRAAERRGGHVALEHPSDAARICLALRARGIVPDFRPPNVIRIAPVALYNTFHEVWLAVDELVRIVASQDYLRYDPNQVEVT
ncbi:MAG: kynureninase [Deltaproteobacteria bacterium]|nr:kynureninase [Deltaproteobacteria bacterium]